MSVIADSRTMFDRQMLHMRRYPVLTFMVMGMPIVFLLLFVFVFGGTLGNGLAGGGGRTAYANYVVPGILLMTVASGAQGAAISVAMDMHEGIIARFRTMAIHRPSVLTGHVLGTTCQTLIGLAVIVGVALLVGFRPDATPVEWLAAIGMLALVTVAVVWLSVALGLVSKSVEAASNTPMPLLLLPFLGSGFVPAESMPAPVRAFAEYQPFTPVMESLRGLLLGTGVGHQALLAVAWCLVGIVGSFFWAGRLYERR